MEQTTLQQRIEERAKEKLLQDLKTASNKEWEIQKMLGEANYNRQIRVDEIYPDRYRKGEIRLANDFTNALFGKLLAKYISDVTDEILQKIDDIDYLVNKPEEEDLP